MEKTHKRLRAQYTRRTLDGTLLLKKKKKTRKRLTGANQETKRRTMTGQEIVLLMALYGCSWRTSSGRWTPSLS
eukprot:9687583-Prorocentrum_lima.AAC.1